MPSQPEIGPRERQILTAIVETYISRGEPVGSRTLSRTSTNKDGLSPATIRNVMADLTDQGYLSQPHTSAGRVPTALAYRYFVEQISGHVKIAPEHEELISGSFQGVEDVQEYMERTSHVLSLISSGVGVAAAVPGKRHELDHVHFTRLTGNKVLAVVVTRSGIVRDRVLRMARGLTQDELETAARYINENFRGWTIDAAQAELARRIEQQRSEYDRLMQALEDIYKGGALEGATAASPSVFVEGVANLIASQEDRDRLSQMLRTLEERQKVADLLDAYLDARQEAVRVVIGLEDAMPEWKDLVLIGAPARVGQDVIGSVAVIGPTRMDYEHTITAVGYIANLFDKILNEKE
jgi:heat-inducible transcriptional repressor